MADPEDESAQTYVATTAFLNIVCAVFIPAGLFFAHAAVQTRQLAFFAFTVLSVACFLSLVRGFLRARRYRLAVFVAASFLAMVAISWLCIWPDVASGWIERPVLDLLKSIWIFEGKHHSRGLDKLLTYVFMACIAISYLLLFLPIMLAGAASQYWSQSRGAFATRMKEAGKASMQRLRILR